MNWNSKLYQEFGNYRLSIFYWFKFFQTIIYIGTYLNTYTWSDVFVIGWYKGQTLLLTYGRSILDEWGEHTYNQHSEKEKFRCTGESEVIVNKRCDWFYVCVFWKNIPAIREEEDLNKQTFFVSTTD